jgi:predicted AAA+ superfamily ATPase
MKNILIEQNPHWQGKFYKSIKREKLNKLISYLPLKQIITISGIRRCGKSTLVKQAINHLIQNKINPKNIFFLNLEHPFFLEYKSNPNYLNTIYEEYLKLINPKGKVYCVFDEIQYFDNWQVYIKNRYENSDIKFIITGSNSTMLSNELNTLLSGRSLNIHLDTFSFAEFLDYKQIPYKSEFDRLSYKIDILRAKDEYLKWGGFYEVFSCEDEIIKKDILISYAKNIIYQDIVPRYKIRNSLIVERLFFYLLSIATGILNYTTLSKTFEISDKTIKEYINYFEDVFLFKRIDRYHTKQKEQIKSSKKLYVLDNGFLQIAPKFSKNLGTMLENSVFNILKSNEDLTYLKDKKEIDFFTNNSLYQVSYDISDNKTLKRELSAFNHFDFKNANKFLITYDINDKIEDIEVMSFENFVFITTPINKLKYGIISSWKK